MKVVELKLSVHEKTLLKMKKRPFPGKTELRPSVLEKLIKKSNKED